MAVHVVPMGSKWVVRYRGRTISNHRLKHRAKEAGRREARKRGVPVTIHRSNGTFQKTVGGGS